MEPFSATIFGIPLVIIVAVAVATYVRAKSYRSTRKTKLGRAIDHVANSLMAFVSGVVLYHPVALALGLSQDYFLMTAVFVALCAEGIMTGIMRMSKDKETVKQILTSILTRLK